MLVVLLIGINNLGNDATSGFTQLNFQNIRNMGANSNQPLITNQNDMFWIWHSGLTTGREGNVTWSDGVVARFGQPIETERPPALESGTYFWAVWALDDQGKPALSTTELTNTVP